MSSEQRLERGEGHSEVLKKAYSCHTRRILVWVRSGEPKGRNDGEGGSCATKERHNSQRSACMTLRTPVPPHKHREIDTESYRSSPAFILRLTHRSAYSRSALVVHACVCHNNDRPSALPLSSSPILPQCLRISLFSLNTFMARENERNSTRVPR